MAWMGPPGSAAQHFFCPMGVCLNSVVVEYLSQNNPGELLRLAGKA